jgi:hypothetical protein
MKNNTLTKVLAVVTLFSINLQFFNWNDGQGPVRTADALYQIQRQLDGGGGGGGTYEIDIEENTDFLLNNNVPAANVTHTAVVPNPTGATKLVCPWECGESYWYPDGFYAIPEMCSEADIMVDDIRASISRGNNSWGNDSVYSAGERVSWDGLWVWQKYNITTGIGWTAWWVGLANYCTALGTWESSNASEISYGDTTSLTFTIEAGAAGNGGYLADLLALTNNTIRMQGRYSSSTSNGGTVTSPTFNSPFIYFDVADGDYSVTLDSEWDKYQSVAPAFTSAAAWDVDVRDSVATVAGAQYSHLFYELAMHKIDLTRNGKNFNTKEELVTYLKESDFFAQLGMTDVEKSNSLEYLLPKLPDAPYYYLTILEGEAIDALSTITISPTPEQLLRTYYAVYPTTSPVKVDADLQFSQTPIKHGSVVKEYGEIIVKPEMYVFWK